MWINRHQHQHHHLIKIRETVKHWLLNYSAVVETIEKSTRKGTMESNVFFLINYKLVFYLIINGWEVLDNWDLGLWTPKKKRVFMDILFSRYTIHWKCQGFVLMVHQYKVGLWLRVTHWTHCKNRACNSNFTQSSGYYLEKLDYLFI